MSSLDASAVNGAAVEQYPLTPLQQGLLFHCLSTGAERLYVSEVVCTFAAGFDPAAFTEAWQRVIDRHSIFRTAFRWDGDTEPVQIVSRRMPVRIERRDWSDAEPEEADRRTKEYCATLHRAGIDLTGAPAMRLALIALSAGRHRFIWIYHHLLMDAWSEGILIEELEAFYAAARAGQDCPRAMPAPYRAYVEWLQRKDRAAASAYWTRYLSGLRQPTPVPGERADSREAGGVPDWDAHTLEMSAADSDLLRQAARQHRLTLNTVVQGGWALVLGEYSRTADVMFGATVAVRPTDVPDLCSTIGLFLNTLPVRVRLLADCAARQWLGGLQQQEIDAREHGHAPLVQIQACSAIPRERPLFETFISFQNMGLVRSGPPRATPPLLPVEGSSFRGGWTNYPMSVDIEPRDRLLLTISFDRTRVTGAAAREVLACLHAALTVIARHIAAPVGLLRELVAAARRRQMAEQHTRLAARQRQRLGDLRQRP